MNSTNLVKLPNEAVDILQQAGHHPDRHIENVLRMRRSGFDGAAVDPFDVHEPVRECLVNEAAEARTAKKAA